jgi:phage replication-related protein YjqB (UPF0714/DUF867 family)
VFAELLAHDGVMEHVALRSRFGFLAFHGGSLERGTAEIASTAASDANASLYAVLQPQNLRWHVPSRLVDPAVSPALAEFLDHVELVVSIHGYGRAGYWTSLLVGGANRTLARRAAATLRSALPGYQVVDTIGSIPSELRGLHPANPVNRARHGGIQLELPPRLRDVPARVADRDALVGALTALARHEPGPQ